MTETLLKVRLDVPIVPELAPALAKELRTLSENATLSWTARLLLSDLAKWVDTVKGKA